MMILRKSSDWHLADIIAALRKKGTTMAALSRKSGLNSSTLSNAMTRSWPKGEWIIVEYLGIHPSKIWPSRYFDKKTGALIDRKNKIRSYRVPEDNQDSTTAIVNSRTMKELEIGGTLPYQLVVGFLGSRICL